MGIFITSSSNIFKGLNNTPTTILSADTNRLEIRTINIDNTGAAPIRFNLSKVRTEGLTTRNCYVASTANLTNIIYDNGLSGIGATITNNSATLTAFTLDGVTPPVNSRILIKDQTSTFQNGIYVLTTVGSNSIPWVLTRATDYNKPAQINPNDLVYIQAGTINKAITYKETAIVVTIGTSPILFAINTSTTIQLTNELEIKPYGSMNIICVIGSTTLQYNSSPFITEKLVCFSNGYTQLFDCNIEYISLNEI